MSRANWLAERRGYIGSSDVAAILGISPYRTALDVYCEKKGLVDVGETESEAAYWGTVMEPVLCQEYARRRHEAGDNIVVIHCDDATGDTRAFGPTGISRTLGGTLPQVKDMLGGVQHPLLPFIRVHLDGVALLPDLTPERGVECKMADRFLMKEWGAEASDEVPARYLVQVMTDMAVIERLDVFDVPVLIGGNTFRIYTVERDDDLIRTIVDQLCEFWERVQTSNPPDAAASEAGKAALALMYPRDNGVTLTAQPEHLPLLRELLRARAAAADAERGQLKAENAVKQVLGEATRIVAGGAQDYVSWARCKDTLGVDADALITHLFDMLALPTAERAALRQQFITTTKTGSRRFTVHLDNWKGAHDGE